MTTVPPLSLGDLAPARRARRAERSLASYLLLPRPGDLTKAVVAPLAFAVGALAGQAGWTDAGGALVVWLALELLVYQARYQWNDVRGFVADQAHPDRASRGRLPGPLSAARSRIGASLSVLALRLALVAALALALPDVAGVLALMTAGVLGAAVVYEGVRSRATGWSDEVPPPLRPALLGLWAWSGAGYAVRGATGLALAVGLSERQLLAAAAAVAMWSTGVVFVTCRWSLEALCFASAGRDGLVWSVRADQAREHTLGLVRWLPRHAGAVDPCHWRALAGRTPLTAPWNLALVLGAAAAALAGPELTAATAGTSAAGVAVLVGGAAALLVALLPPHRLLMALGGAVVLLLVPATAGAPLDPRAAVPWLVVVGGYLCFTRQCADEVGDPLRRWRSRA